MRAFNIVFTDEEFGEMALAKEKSGCRNWHDYILLVVRERELVKSNETNKVMVG